jgi:hypothetical protein
VQDADRGAIGVLPEGVHVQNSPPGLLGPAWIADRRLRSYEQCLLQALVGVRAAGTTVDLSEARRGLAAGIPAIRRELTASLVAAGLFESNPLIDDWAAEVAAAAAASARPLRSCQLALSVATHSMWYVCGNMSTGWTSSNV